MRKDRWELLLFGIASLLALLAAGLCLAIGLLPPRLLRRRSRPGAIRPADAR